MSNLYERAIEYAKNARETLIDRYSSSAGGAKGGKAIWLGYDSQGKGIVKQEGVTKTVNVEGRISLPPGATVMVDENGTISVRQPSKPDPKKKAIEPKKKKRRVLKKNRPLIITAEEQEILIENVEYQLSSIWVTRDPATGWRYVYGSNGGIIGSYNTEGELYGFAANYNTLADQTKQHLAQVKVNTIESIYSNPRYQFSHTLFSSVPYREGFANGYVASADPSCQILNNKLYVTECIWLRIALEFSHSSVVFRDTGIPAIFDTERTFTIASLSGVTMYTLDLLTLEETFDYNFYLEQTLDVSGLTDFTWNFPFDSTFRWTGTWAVNVDSKDPESVIKGLLPAENQLKNCNSSIWIKDDVTDTAIDKKVPFGQYQVVTTNSFRYGFHYEFPWYYSGPYNYWVQYLHLSNYYRNLKIDCFARASAVVQDLPDPEQFLIYYFRANQIEIFLDGVETKAVMVHAVLVEDFDLCSQFMYLNSTWEGSVPELGEERSFASISRSREDYFIKAGLIPTGDVGAFLAEPNLTAFLDSNSLTYGRNTVEVAPVVARRIFDSNLTDNTDYTPPYILNLIGQTEQVLFVGYRIHDITIEQQSGIIQP
jgi:hypothetical protein